MEKAEQNPRHKMALTFRWYLGQSSRWANVGQDGREEDYQIWCGPSMGAFNEWAAGTELEGVSSRTVVRVARNILFGAALHLRATRYAPAGDSGAGSGVGVETGARRRARRGVE